MSKMIIRSFQCFGSSLVSSLHLKITIGILEIVEKIVEPQKLLNLEIVDLKNKGPLFTEFL